MRQYLLTFLFCPFSLLAQTNVYHPIPDSAAVWAEEGVYLVSSDPFDLNYFERSYVTDGDTMIGSYIYTRIHSNYHDYLYFYGYGHFYYSYTLYLMRQDTASRKVYLYMNGGDTLLYDYNLNVGDILPPSFKLLWSNNTTITVSSIDSVQVGTVYHKRIRTSLGFWDLIEGVGSNQGFIPVMLDFEAGDNYIRCFSRNGITAYSYSSFTGNCQPLGSSEQSIASALAISPNPSSGSHSILTAAAQALESLKCIIRWDSGSGWKLLLPPNSGLI